MKVVGRVLVRGNLQSIAVFLGDHGLTDGVYEITECMHELSLKRIGHSHLGERTVTFHTPDGLFETHALITDNEWSTMSALGHPSVEPRASKRQD